eukprot:scaffold255857_cov17-Tisochrysis_lutea.AAC.1
MELRNKVTFDASPTNPQADITGTGSCKFWITSTDLVRPKPSTQHIPTPEQRPLAPLPHLPHHPRDCQRSTPYKRHASMAQM